MTALRRLGVNSTIYTATNMLQKGAAFLLLPLYTRFLDPSAYGVLAVVTAVNGLLSVLFTLGLTGAITRFYFEYQDSPETLAEFWGTVFTFIFLVSTLLVIVMLTVGQSLLKPLTGGIPFWPYVALGVLTTLFQPFFTTYLALLQMRNEARRFALLSLGNFLMLTALTVALVVVMGRGVEGSLLAALLSTMASFGISLWLLRSQLRISLRWRHLRPALSYSLPLVPHSVAGQTTAFADRIVLNGYSGAAAAGLYSVGGMVAMVVEVTAQSVNRAYVPLTMAALKRGSPQDLGEIESMATAIVGGFLMFGAAIGAFGGEILRLLASPEFASAAAIIPWLVFAGAANAIYLVFVNVLFYDRSGVRLVPVGTITGAICSVVFALCLVPRFGLMGGAVSALLAQAVATVVIATLGRRLDPVNWHYWRIAAAFVLALSFSILLSRAHLAYPLTTIAVKLAGLAALSGLIGMMFWRSPLAMASMLVRLVRFGATQTAGLLNRRRAQE